MGVQYITTHLKDKVRDGEHDVDIGEQIKAYEEEKNKPPLIVVDMKPFFGWKFNREILICGGRHQLYEKRLRTLFSELSSLGAQLVFFADGPPLDEWGWCRKMDEKARKEQECLRMLHKKNTHRLSKDAPVGFLSTFDRTFYRVAREFGELHFAFRTEINRAIARYATNNEALAVISQDSDFLIFEGDWQFWTIMSIDVDAMTTKGFSRKGLRDYFGIEEEQLPLLASLAGNEITKDSVDSFHQKITTKQNLVDFDQIATFLAKVPPGSLSERLEFIALNATGRTNPEFIAKLRKSLAFYDISTETKNKDEVEEGSLQEKILDNIDDPIVYLLYEEIPTEWSPYYFDYSDPNLPSFSKMVRKVLNRMAGIVLRRKYPIDYKEQQFLCKPTESEPFQKLKIRPIPPDIDFPDLDELLFGNDNNKSLHKTRLDLLASIMSPNLTSIHCVEPRHLSAALTQHLLVENNFLTVQEAYIALICTEHSISGKIPDELTAPEWLNKRHLMLAFLIPIIQKLVNQAMDVCGLGKHARVDFDGVYLHRMLQDWDSKTEEEQAELLSEISDYRLSF